MCVRGSPPRPRARLAPSHKEEDRETESDPPVRLFFSTSFLFYCHGTRTAAPCLCTWVNGCVAEDIRLRDARARVCKRRYDISIREGDALLRRLFRLMHPCARAGRLPRVCVCVYTMGMRSQSIAVAYIYIR